MSRERVTSLERSKASLGSKLAAAQEEAAHMKTELGDQSSQAAKLKAQLHSINDAHSKVNAAVASADCPYLAELGDQRYPGRTSGSFLMSYTVTLAKEVL